MDSFALRLAHTILNLSVLVYPARLMMYIIFLTCIVDYIQSIATNAHQGERDL